MFGKKKMYKKGLADAMTAYEEFGKKQEDALNAAREEVRAGKKQLEEALSGLGNELNGIYDYLDGKEKAALYHLNTPYNIKELEEAEQRLLLVVLYQLAENEGSNLNDYQRTYIHGVQRFLGITNPQIGLDDLSVVGDIDSGSTQKAILQTVLEFFYLQDSDELTDEQEEFLSNFSVNKKQAQTIGQTVSRLYNAVGPKGLSEKYGNDEVIQQAKDQAMDAFKIFEENVDANGLHVFCSTACSIDPDKTISFSEMICDAGAYGDSDSFKNKEKCQGNAERLLERCRRDSEKQMDTYTKRYGEESIYKKLSDELSNRIEHLKEDLKQIPRNTHTIPILNQIATSLTKSKILDDMATKNDQLKGKYALPSLSYYSSKIEYEVNDPSEYEDNVLAKIIASRFKTYGYDLNTSLRDMRKDGRENLKNFAEDLTAQFNDLIDRFIIDPIQQLLPKLRDALCDTSEND